MAAEPKVSALLAVALAFAAGCLPSARLVTRLARGVSIEELGDGKPGASNVYRTLGPIPGAAVLVLDSLKAYVPAASLGARGASEGVVAAAAVAPVAAHVAVIGGQGAAAALGAGFAIDTPATLIAVIPILGGTLLGYHAQGVLAAALVFPAACGLRRPRRVALQAAALPVILVAARLRGPRGSGPPRSARAALNRLLRDRDA